MVNADKQREVLWATLRAPPAPLGVTHWSSRRVIVPWCAWLLTAADRVVQERQALLEQVEAIGSQIFHRGDMRTLVDELDVERLGHTLQHTVGLAIAPGFR